MEIGDVGTVGVVGAGLMGSGIALNFALAGYETIVCDLEDDVLAGARARIDGALAMFVEEGLTTSADADAAVARIAADHRSGRPVAALGLHHRSDSRAAGGQTAAFSSS